MGAIQGPKQATDAKLSIFPVRGAVPGERGANPHWIARWMMTPGEPRSGPNVPPGPEALAFRGA